MKGDFYNEGFESDDLEEYTKTIKSQFSRASAQKSKGKIYSNEIPYNPEKDEKIEHKTISYDRNKDIHNGEKGKSDKKAGKEISPSKTGKGEYNTIEVSKPRAKDKKELPNKKEYPNRMPEKDNKIQSNKKIPAKENKISIKDKLSIVRMALHAAIAELHIINRICQQTVGRKRYAHSPVFRSKG